MTTPSNPDNFDTDAFSPPPRYRETTLKDLVDSVAGPEPQAMPAYPMRYRLFIELQPYDDEE